MLRGRCLCTLLPGQNQELEPTENVRMWPWLFQDRTGGPGVSYPISCTNSYFAIPRRLLGPLHPAFSSQHVYTVSWILNWGPLHRLPGLSGPLGPGRQQRCGPAAPLL